MYAHPIELLPMYAERAKQILGENFEFEFSKYNYIPQQVSEKRNFFSASIDQVDKILEREKKALVKNEEIAFHSRVSSQSRHVHLPFIDMGCAGIEPYLMELENAFRDFGIDEYSLFHSGRSFHVYAHSILPDDAALIRFMGRILLLNLPNQERIIDERWVGHRLMAGYLTLRWTNNNPHYKCMPTGYQPKSAQTAAK